MKTLIFGSLGGGLSCEAAARGGGARVWRGGFLALAAAALLLGQAPARGSETDENLEASARGAYVFRKLLAEEGISMEVSNGMVTLRGSVALGLQRELAEEAVAALPGVKGIDNQIVVKPAPPGTADELLALRVRTILGLHRSGAGHAARLEVKDGVVTLRGEVENEAQRALAAEYAADVEGVSEVRNGLTVAPAKAGEGAPGKEAKAVNGRAPAEPGAAEPTAEVDDASVVAQVRMALRAHRSTRALKPGVDAREGVVTLTGHVTTAAEGEMAERMCRDILGVRKVVNKTTPEPESTEN